MLRKVDASIRAIEENMFREDMREIRAGDFGSPGYHRAALVVKPQILIVSNLERKERAFIQEELDVYFGDIADGFSRAGHPEDYREVIEGLSETSHSVTSYRINDVMRILTVISVMMLPLTLITGIYGMNLEWLPAADTFYGFFIVIGFMVLGGRQHARLFPQARHRIISDRAGRHTPHRSHYEQRTQHNVHGGEQAQFVGRPS